MNNVLTQMEVKKVEYDKENNKKITTEHKFREFVEKV
jgi:hypothetical protein